jgi:hypothetical protein
VTDTVKLVSTNLPELDVSAEGSELVVRGTLEQHEAVAALLNGSPAKSTTKFKRVPVRAVMKKLEESGVVFTYDAAKLEAAGIDLDQAIDLEVDKATADEFFQALFTPLKLAFEIDNLTVKLTPKK